MRTLTSWGGNTDVFELVSRALYKYMDTAAYIIDVAPNQELDISTSPNTEDRYGDMGYIIIELNGQRYSLTLNKEH